MAKTRNVDNSKYWQAHLEMGTLMHCMRHSNFEKQSAVFTEINLHLHYDLVISPGMYHRTMIAEFHTWTHFKDDCGGYVCPGAGR